MLLDTQGQIAYTSTHNKRLSIICSKMDYKAPIPDNDVPDSTETLKGQNEHIKTADSAHRALMGRRSFSLRLQIYLEFFMVFLFAVGIAALILITTYQVEEKLRILAVVNEYGFEIQQARRFEKNYLLYGTNLVEALESLHQAKNIFGHNADRFILTQKRAGQDSIPTDLDLYEGLLKRLFELDQYEIADNQYGQDRKEIELELRKHGQKIVSFAQGLVEQEKAALSRALDRSENIHIYSLVILLMFVFFNAYILDSRIPDINRRRSMKRHLWIPLLLIPLFWVVWSLTAKDQGDLAWGDIITVRGGLRLMLTDPSLGIKALSRGIFATADGFLFCATLVLWVLTIIGMLLGRKKKYPDPSPETQG